MPLHHIGEHRKDGVDFEVGESNLLGFMGSEVSEFAYGVEKGSGCFGKAVMIFKILQFFEKCIGGGLLSGTGI